MVYAVTLGEDNFLTRNWFLLNPVNLEPQEPILFASKWIWGVVAASCRVFAKMSKNVKKARRCGGALRRTHFGARKSTFWKEGWEWGAETLNTA